MYTKYGVMASYVVHIRMLLLPIPARFRAVGNMSVGLFPGVDAYHSETFRCKITPFR